MRRGIPWISAALVVLFALVAAAPAPAAAPGGIDQLAPPNGCITNGGSGGCKSSHDLSRGFDSVVSPDGRHVYATAFDLSAVLTFDRDPATGALTQKAGTAGCVHHGSATADCAAATNLFAPAGIELSNDGATAYVVARGSSAVAVFDRDPSTGALTQKSGATGCIADTGSATCADARAMQTPNFLWKSPDGRFLYVSSEISSSVTALAIQSDGTLAQVSDGPGGYGCVQNVPGADDCADGRAMNGPFSITGTPNGETVYVGAFADHSVSALNREASSGRLTPVTGSAGCVDAEGTDGCTTVTDLSAVRGLAVAPGSQHVYAAATEAGKVILFDRQPNGGLVRRAGIGGCIAQTADPGCRVGRAMVSPAGLAVSPDGDDVYVASFGLNSGLVELDRAADGVLTPRPGTRGCVAAGTPPADCAAATVVSSMYTPTLSPDARNIYVSAFQSASFGVFRRDSSGAVCANESRTVEQGTTTALSIPCTDVDGDPVNTEIMSQPTLGGLGAVDQATDQVNYSAPQGQCGGTSFTYRGTSSGLTSGTATYALTVTGCATATPPTSGDDACANAKAKLKKAKKKLKKLKQQGARAAAIEKAEKKVKQAKKKVKQACG